MKRKYTNAIGFIIFFVAAFTLFLPDSFAVSYFSYQSGNWIGANVWTTDSTGTTLVGSATPGSNDKAYILTGRTITVSQSIATTGNTITINLGAVLNMSTYTIPAITLNGNGLFRTGRTTMPTISGGTFLAAGGGTVEYYAATGNFDLDVARPSYFNLIINLGTTTQVVTAALNLTIFGSLTITRGTFQINNTTTTKRTILIYGNATIGLNGKITTGTGNTNTVPYSIASSTLPPGGQFHTIFHEMIIGGNFTNNGTARFTNLAAPNYGEFASTGAVTVRFTGESNCTVTLNGLTDFYNLIIDKGTDQTYILTVYSSSTANFALYGPNSVGRNEASPFTPDNPEVRKALWIKNGTLKLTGTMLIPTLTEGYIDGNDGNGDYPIGSNGQLWIAGANVSVYSTATNNSGFPQAPANSAGVEPPGTVHQAISIYGKLRISDGYLSSRHSAGIIFWNTANSNSAVIVEGGTVNVSVMRTTVTSSGKTSYLQTGGTVIVRGDETEAGEMSPYPIFSIPDPNSSFLMSGGEIIIRDRNNGTGAEGNGIYLNCDPGNFSVTGGTITIETNPANSPSIDIYSKVNLWNLNIKRMTGSGNSVVNLLYGLNVSSTLTVFANGTLSSGTGSFPVTVSGDFRINSGATYTPGLNTTLFNGYGNFFLWNEGTITNGLYNLQLNQDYGSVIIVSTSGSMTVRNDLVITQGILADGGNIVYVGGNVTNNGTHLGAGKISLNKTTGPQTIYGNGQGTFQNLELNNTFGTGGSTQVSLAADITVTGVLNLANDRLFNINQFQLSLMELASVQGTLGSSRFILTSGAPSAGGVRRIYTDTLAFTFPVGTSGNYTPATIHVRKIPTSYGSITVKPVPSKHPFATNATCLAYYWKVEESGFEGLKLGSVRLYFNYGNLADNALYVPGKYVPATWAYLNDVTLVEEATNMIRFNGENGVEGDYTAGIPAAFGAVTVFYSRATGLWNAPATWSNTGFSGPAASTIPGAANPVFIGNGSTYNHTVTVTAGTALSGSLSLQKGSTLDLGYTTGNNFGVVLPGSTGKLRISANTATSVFPAGDFGTFLGVEGGTVDYYSTGTVDFTLPVTTSAPTSRAIATYFNLMLTPGTGRSITMPNTDLLLYGDMTVQGASGTALARLNAAAARTLTIRNNLAVTSGNLLYQNTMAQAVRIDNDLKISTGATFNVPNSGTGVNNTLSIGGSLFNDGSFDMSISALIKCDVTFTGNTYNTIAGKGTLTDFYSLTVDKGSSSAPVLDVTSTAFSFTNNTAPLTLLNGTFRLNNSGLSVTISTMGFTIPATTSLSAYAGTILVGTSANDEADITLIGTLEVGGGTINVGTATNNINNDIEYAGAGLPTILITSGTLFVNGQIRRSLINGLGSLIYDQSGASTVTVNGRNAQSVRAKLEVLNTGSIFNMDGGTLTIVRGGSVVFNDLLLKPASSTVTGGTIIFGNSSTENTNNTNSFVLDAAIPLYNLTVDGTTTSKTVTLYVHSLTLQGNLTIRPTSVFFADSLEVKIAGNFTNQNTSATTGVNTGGYRPGSLNQVTTFNGSLTNQTITGVSNNVTNFANLVMNNTLSGGTVTLQTATAVRVNTDLTLTRGMLVDGGNIITVLGNISNSAGHSGTGYILLAGSVVQKLSGNGLGKFGNLYLNPNYDVRQTVYMEISGVLTFQSKMLDIGNNLLKLSNTGAAISGSSATSYIRTDGLISDAGVQKYFPATTYNFLFPVGVRGKYTPARLATSANNATGTITITPVNRAHPCRSGTGTNIVSYYWHASKTGFNTYTITHTYTYVDADAGSENNYFGDRYYAGLWDTPPCGTVSPSTNEITFASKTFIDGDYTAGRSTEFASVLTYYSRTATCTSPAVGNWDVYATWSTDPVLKHTGAAASSYPTGEPVVIATNHIVSTNGDSRSSSNVSLNGTAILSLGTTVGHFLGIVTGTGTIRLTSSLAGYFVFPSGNFSAFTAPAGGTIELTTTTGTASFPYLTTYNNLVLKGAGTKLMIDADINLNGILTNESTSGFTASSIANLTLAADWINDGAFTHNSGSTIFDGATTLRGINPPVLNKITINAAKTLTGPLSSTFGVAGDWINDGTFNHNAGTVDFSGYSTISGASLLTFNNIILESNKTLVGKYRDNIVMLGNWVNNGSFIHNLGGVVFNGTSLVSGSSGTLFGTVIINAGHSLTGPPSGTMSIALDFYNDGTFNHNHGTLSFEGSNQILGGTATALFENISVASGSITTIKTSGQKLRGVLLSNGILNADDNLTLLSDAGQTALIDGSGTGEVDGDVFIHRYLPHRFGYKYFGSPFREATVDQFGSFMDLGADFPTFYRYDENRFYTGWITYTNPSGILAPMQAYAVNFGPTSPPLTVELIGVVNNSTQIPATLFNSNRPFTLGFNLIGNPYPSPIDWNASFGWVRSNIDNALYYFNAGTTNQYTGTYSTYINNVSSDGIANNIIPAMQGFFIHVSDGSYPVAATLIFTNYVRVNNLSPNFHKAAFEETRPLLRLTAKLADEAMAADPLVIYFDYDAIPAFDKERDALKLLNTDVTVPSLYTISPDNDHLSIYGMPYPVDSVTIVPLGLDLKTGGDILFSARNLERMPFNLYTYLCDSKTGAWVNLDLHPDYIVHLASGKYENRFSIVFSRYDLRYRPGESEPFHVYSSRNRLYIYIDQPTGDKTDLVIHNMLGQVMLRQQLTGNGYQELDVNFSTGIYIIGLNSAKGTYTKKVFINSQWE